MELAIIGSDIQVGVAQWVWSSMGSVMYKWVWLKVWYRIVLIGLPISCIKFVIAVYCCCLLLLSLLGSDWLRSGYQHIVTRNVSLNCDVV